MVVQKRHNKEKEHDNLTAKDGDSSCSWTSPSICKINVADFFGKGQKYAHLIRDWGLLVNEQIFEKQTVLIFLVAKRLRKIWRSMKNTVEKSLESLGGFFSANYQNLCFSVAHDRNVHSDGELITKDAILIKDYVGRRTVTVTVFELYPQVKRNI